MLNVVFLSPLTEFKWLQMKDVLKDDMGQHTAIIYVFGNVYNLLKRFILDPPGRSTAGGLIEVHYG